MVLSVTTFFHTTNSLTRRKKICFFPYFISVRLAPFFFCYVTNSFSRGKEISFLDGKIIFIGFIIFDHLLSLPSPVDCFASYWYLIQDYFRSFIRWMPEASLLKASCHFSHRMQLVFDWVKTSLIITVTLMSRMSASRSYFWLKVELTIQCWKIWLKKKKYPRFNYFQRIRRRDRV